MDAVCPDLIANRFEVGDLIGDGGLSFVFSGWDRLKERKVAVKWLKRDVIGTHEKLARSLWQEASALSAVRHPNVVTIYDFGVNDEGGYIISELLEGETLEKVLVRNPFDLEHFFVFAKEALAGLSAAHRVFVLHRDINPTNFFLEIAPDVPFRVKLLDFGQAKYTRKPTPQTVDQENALLGSIHYVSPEQFDRLPMDQRSDLYALGCVFFEAITGHEAFYGSNVTEIMNAHLQGLVPPMVELRPGIPPGLEKWLRKMISRKPDDRYATAVLALEALQQVEKKIYGS